MKPVKPVENKKELISHKVDPRDRHGLIPRDLRDNVIKRATKIY